MSESPSHRTIWQRPEFLVGLCIVLAYLLVWPVGDYVIEDDWAFSLTLRNLHENGEVRILHWIPVTLVTHLFTGLLFTKLLGFQLTVLKLTTVLLMGVGIWAVMDLLRRLEVGPGVVAAAGLTLLFNPLFFFQGFLYATDIPALAWGSLALLFYFRGLVERDSGPVIPLCWLASAFASLAWGVRQSAVLVVGAVLLHLLFFGGRNRRRLMVWLSCFLLPAISVAGFQAWYHGVHGPTGTYVQYRDGVLRSLGHLSGLASAESVFLLAMYAAFFILPVALALAPAARTGGRSGGSVAGGVVGLFLAGMFLWASSGRGVHFPYIQNKLTQFGFLSPNEILLGDRPVLWGSVAGWAFTVVLAAGAILAGYQMTRGLFETVFAAAETGPRSHGLRLVFLLLVLQVLYAFVTMPILFDRHLLLLAPTTLILLVGLAGGQARLRPALFLPALLLMAFYSVAATHDLHAVSRTAHQAGEDLRSQGVDPRHIDAGLAFDGWHLFERSLAELRSGEPPLVQGHDAAYLHNLIPRARPRYVVSLSASLHPQDWEPALPHWARRGSLQPRLDRHDIIREYPYRTYWPWERRTLYVLKERGTP
jgi:hypothetical protein